MSTFEVLASEEERLSGTRAVIAAQTRSKEKFGAFVEKASNDIEREARISLISGDLEAVLAEVANEYDYDNIERLRNAATVALGGGHASDCTCGFCENKGSFGKEDDGEEREKEERAEAVEDWAKRDKESKTSAVCAECHHPIDKHEAGTDDEGGNGCEFCDCKRVAVKDELHSASVKESEYKYVKKQGDKWVITQKGTGKVLSTHDSEEDAKSAFRAMEMNMHGGSVSPRVIPEFPWDRVAADVEDGDSFQKERIDLGASKDGLEDVGSPKIDKSRVPEDGLKPIDVGSEQHHLEHQDATDRAEYNDPDFDPQNGVTDRIDADTPLQPEHNVADNTETWTGTEGLASPVTSNLAKWSVLT